jgi:hypothetical protein
MEGIDMFKKGQIRLEATQIPFYRYRMIPLHVVDTTERYFGTFKTRYLSVLKQVIFGREIR